MIQAHSRRQGRDREKRRLFRRLISSKVGATTFILAVKLRFSIVLVSFDAVTCQNLLRERDQVSLLVIKIRHDSYYGRSQTLCRLCTQGNVRSMLVGLSSCDTIYF